MPELINFMQVSLATGRRPSLDVVSSPSPPLLSPKVKMFTALLFEDEILLVWIISKVFILGNRDAQG